MPHKHRRDKTSAQDYNLPPDKIAKPLSVSKTPKPASAKGGKPPTTKAKSEGPSKKRKRNKNDDDTPKAFARLMAFQQGQKPKSGLDDGSQQRSTKKQKTKNAAQDVEAPENQEHITAETKTEVPRIMPGERMADFAARVDAALPIGGLVGKGNVKLDGVKRQRTKLERKITRMQDEWRERDKRMKNKAAEAEEDAEIEAILNGEEGARASRILQDPDEPVGQKKRKGKKGKRRKAGDESDEDPWAAVAKARKQTEQSNKGLVGVHDVVQEPPRFEVKPKERFKIKNGTLVDATRIA